MFNFKLKADVKEKIQSVALTTNWINII